MGSIGLDLTGYLSLFVAAAALAVGGQYVVTQQVKVNRNLIYMFGLAVVGAFGGSELFGEIGSIHSLSANGPAIGGFYILTGLIGGLVVVAAASLGQRRKEAGLATDLKSQGIQDPKLAHLLFNDSRAAALWLAVRVYVGYEWLAAGWHKVTDPAWMDGGSALAGYWERVVAIPEQGQPAITYGWYRDFLGYMNDQGWYTWFAKLVAVGEVLIGVALLVGVVVGIAAFFGALMNFSFMLAGSASTNPVLFAFAVGLILAWKVAGYWGLDRYLLPALGAPWSPGKVFTQQPAPAPTA